MEPGFFVKHFVKDLGIALGKIAAFVLLGFFLYGSYFKLNPYEASENAG